MCVSSGLKVYWEGGLCWRRKGKDCFDCSYRRCWQIGDTGSGCSGICRRARRFHRSVTPVSALSTCMGEGEGFWNDSALGRVEPRCIESTRVETTVT